MKRLLSLLLLAGCTTPLVQPARIAIPAAAVAVEGANPRTWNQPISFGDWHTAIVNEGTTRSFLYDLGMLEAGKQFRCANGHLHLRTLPAALERHVASENVAANAHNDTVTAA